MSTDREQWTLTICGKCRVKFGHRYCDQCGSSAYREQITVVLLSAVEEVEAERAAVIDCLNIYGGSLIHEALDAAGLLKDQQ